MENIKNIISDKKKLIIIIVIIAVICTVLLLFVFKPWETALTTTADNNAYSAALEDPSSHVGEEVSFVAEVITDSVNIEGMLMLSGSVDNQYVVSLSYLDPTKNMSFNIGEKIKVTGMITGAELVPLSDGNSLNGAGIAVESIESDYQ